MPREDYLVDENLAKNDKGADGSPEPIRWIAKIVVTGGPPVRMALPGTDKLISHRLKDIPPGTCPEPDMRFTELISIPISLTAL